MRIAKNEKVLKKCSPNRHGPVYLIEVTGKDKLLTYYVSEEQDPEYCEDPNIYEAESLIDGERVYKEWVKELQDTPNQQAQDEYDDAHGTVNGFAPWQADGFGY